MNAKLRIVVVDDDPGMTQTAARGMRFFPVPLPTREVHL